MRRGTVVPKRPSDRSAASVLVVEDEQPIGRRLADFLRDQSCAVRTAVHGANALCQLRSWPTLIVLDLRMPVIVLDLRMPVMDGHAFRRAQLAHPEWRTIPVAVVSPTHGHSTEGVTPRARAVIAKPSRFDELLPLVQARVGRVA